MEQYPQTFTEFEKQFTTDEACRDYLFQIRWPDGFQCPRCQKQKAWKTSRQLYHCVNCGHQTSVTAGTIFQDTRYPLKIWFVAMWYVVSQKMESVPWASSVYLDFQGTKQHGNGCIN